jgi:protein-L-isoaspartate(D-aspartate) O-methyltransferase
MVAEQLAARSLADERVQAAMRRVPREEFVPPELRDQAYDDGPLPIGGGQTISQPFTVAFMAAEARIRPGDRVLEIGTGSGYGAAVLAELAAEVHTVERLPHLAEQAAERLRRLGYANVHVHTGDGTLGWPAAAPYDAIVVTAGALSLPPAYLDQLAEEGRLIVPVGREIDEQLMLRVTKHNGQLRQESLGPFRFVPLIGRFGWGEGEA